MKEPNRDDLEGTDSGLAQRLRFLRTRVLHLSQQELAEKLSTTQTTLSNYEKPRRSPTADFFRRLQEGFGVDANWLLTGRGDWQLDEFYVPEQESRQPALNLHPDDMELLARIRRRLQERYHPSAFSRPVVVAVPSSGEPPSRHPAARGYRAIPYTANVDAIGREPLGEEEVAGYFVVQARSSPAAENIRCLQLPDGQYKPTFPIGSILAVDVTVPSTPLPQLEGHVLLVEWESSPGGKRRSLARLAATDPHAVFEPVGDSREVPEFADVKLGRVSVVGRVDWAWHRVV